MLYFRIVVNKVYPILVALITACFCAHATIIDKVIIRNSGQGSGNNFYTDNLQIEVIPEPATVGLFGLFGAIGLFIRKKFAV